MTGPPHHLYIMSDAVDGTARKLLAELKGHQMTNTQKAEARQFLREHGWRDVKREVMGKMVELWIPPGTINVIPFALETAYTKQKENEEMKNNPKKGRKK